MRKKHRLKTLLLIIVAATSGATTGCNRSRALHQQLVSENVDARIQALEKLSALSPTKKEKLVSPLIQDFQNNDSRIANRAVVALGIIGSDAVPALVDALQSPDVFVRLSAAATIEKIGEPAQIAIPQLERALNDPHPLVRQQAEEALDRLRPAAPQSTNS